jgi:hypothetical protein
MNDELTAKAQRNITYLWMAGFFGIIAGQGLGFLKGIPNDVYTLTAVVLFFWFNRSRSPEPPNPATTTTKQTVETVTTPTEKP